MPALERFRVWLAAILVAGCALSEARAAEPAVAIRHVFVIVLENEGFDKTFTAKSPAPYLSKALVKQGALLTQYFGTGHASLDNYLAMISGQAATLETRADCKIFTNFIQTGTTPDGQAIGHGCVYPRSVKTLAGQLDAAGLSWRGYMEDMGIDPSRGVATTCGHPQIGYEDRTQEAGAPLQVPLWGDQYATRHNPFVYFHAIIDSPDCAKRVIRLEQLATDLKSLATTPNFSFITPNLCHDGHDQPCKNYFLPNSPSGLAAADLFLKQWVPLIIGSAAFKADGLLIITFDESDETSKVAKPDGGFVITYAGASCCNQQPGPNLGSFPQKDSPDRNDYVTQSFGGDRIGAVLLSPFIKPGTVSKTPYNHYSLLKSVEDLLHLDGHLGYAGQDGLVGFGADIFTKLPKH